MNFRESKDLTFDKVLIYQTKDFYIYILAPKKINAIFFVNIIKKHNFAKQLGSIILS